MKLIMILLRFGKVHGSLAKIVRRAGDDRLLPTRATLW
jgi:hypothetical protein